MAFIDHILLAMTKMHIRFFTFLSGKFVGQDEYGNRYFKSKSSANRRWVLYKNTQEATKIPPEWDGWLHHMIDTPLKKDGKFYKDWIKPHQENQTGLITAYRPTGHPLNKGKREKATGDYTAWTP